MAHDAPLGDGRGRAHPTHRRRGDDRRPRSALPPVLPASRSGGPAGPRRRAARDVSLHGRDDLPGAVVGGDRRVRGPRVAARLVPPVPASGRRLELRRSGVPAIGSPLELPLDAPGAGGDPPRARSHRAGRVDARCRRTVPPVASALPIALPRHGGGCELARAHVPALLLLRRVARARVRDALGGVATDGRARATRSWKRVRASRRTCAMGRSSWVGVRGRAPPTSRGAIRTGGEQRRFRCSRW